MSGREVLLRLSSLTSGAWLGLDLLRRRREELGLMDVTKYVLQEAARCADGLPDDRVRRISYVLDRPRVRHE